MAGAPLHVMRLALVCVAACRALVGVRVLPRHSPRRRGRGGGAPPKMVFDFFQKAGEDLSAFVEARARADREKLAKFADGLAKSRDALAADLAAVFAGATGGDLDATLEGLEDALLAADIGVATTDDVLADVRRAALRSGASSARDVAAILRGRMREVLVGGGGAALARAESGPTVVLVIGANGMGKTTTIGKLAARLRTEGGARVLLAAADTFRAAAVDQLDAWGRRAGVDVVVPAAGVVSPSAVAYAALDVAAGDVPPDRAYAEAAGGGPYDVVVVDTSGRLATNRNLVEELKKVRRTLEKRLPGAPHEVLLVVDAAVGRNAADQARAWADAVGVTGLVVTKLDGTSRAGFVVGVVRDLGIPVKLVGVGERLDDLRDFDPDAFLDALLDTDAADADDLEARFRALAAAPPVVEAPPPPPVPAAARKATTTKKKKKKKKKAR